MGIGIIYCPTDTRLHEFLIALHIIQVFLFVTTLHSCYFMGILAFNIFGLMTLGTVI